MVNLDTIIKQLRQEEGEKLSAYKDHLGYLTIGIGVLIDARKGGAITQEESAYLLKNRLDKIITRLSDFPFWPYLNDARQAVLIQMAYQMGIDGLLKFKGTLKAVSDGNYLAASQRMLDSLWATQTPARAKRLAEQMKTGEWVFKE